MEALIVRGGRPLTGTVRVSGAKNSALKLAAASLLAEGRSVVSNVPVIGDVRVMADVLRHLGVRVDRRSTPSGRDVYTYDVPARVGLEVPEHLGRRLRASVVVLGPLLARGGRARVALPGGCNLGNRNIDMHLAGLEQLGATIEHGPNWVEARSDGLVGAHIQLPFASVGATENLLMAAVTAQGVTRISNAAREPEIADLAAFLNRMGADITGAGTTEITVHGVEGLQPATHEVLPDRIEAGTYAVAAAVTNGAVTLDGVNPDHLRLPLEKLADTGAKVEEDHGRVTVRGTGTLTATDVVTLPYPGFPTDLQPQLLVLLSQAAGTSMLTENVFDGRFSILEPLVRMGADIALEGHHAIVRGASRLRGAQVRATDLRAGAALVLAGLVAEGETVVTEPHHIDRGYANFVDTLCALGAMVQRRPVQDADRAAGAA